jgi:hypothetical protein
MLFGNPRYPTQCSGTSSPEYREIWLLGFRAKKNTSPKKEIEDMMENPLEEETPLFQRAFEMCLFSLKQILSGFGRE